MEIINRLVVELARKKRAGIDISDLDVLRTMECAPEFTNYVRSYSVEDWRQEAPFWERMVDGYLNPVQAVVA